MARYVGVMLGQNAAGVGVDLAAPSQREPGAHEAGVHESRA
jgi:hypothetical protein